MASLNTLRTKFGALLSIIIALALLAFILSLKTDMGFSNNDPKIGEINGDKIALSLKFPEQNPWLHAAEKYAVGNIVEGKIARMTDFGAFIELEPGVDALLHVSQISRTHVDKPSDVLKVGQEITAKVVDFNEEEKKISLSMKVLEPAKEEAADPAQENQEETVEE